MNLKINAMARINSVMYSSFPTSIIIIQIKSKEISPITTEQINLSCRKKKILFSQ